MGASGSARYCLPSPARHLSCRCTQRHACRAGRGSQYWRLRWAPTSSAAAPGHQHAHAAKRADAAAPAASAGSVEGPAGPVARDRQRRRARRQQGPLQHLTSAMASSAAASSACACVVLGNLSSVVEEFASTAQEQMLRWRTRYSARALRAAEVLSRIPAYPSARCARCVEVARRGGGQACRRRSHRSQAGPLQGLGAEARGRLVMLVRKKESAARHRAANRRLADSPVHAPAAAPRQPTG
jgi:hypothetical protein